MEHSWKNNQANASVSFKYSTKLRQCITDRLSNFERQQLPLQGLRSAAVAIVIVGGSQNGEASILLTRRPMHLKNHSGQFALPGGKVDDGETGPAAAFRELQEELGLDLSSNHLMGLLDEYPTRSGFRILPVVIWGGDKPELKPNPKEVAGVFYISLRELDNPNLCQTKKSDTGAHPVLSINLPSAGGSVYAPTAALLYQFREVALKQRQTRVNQFDQPKFAWK